MVLKSTNLAKILKQAIEWRKVTIIKRCICLRGVWYVEF